jgi:NAD(P) transhydrogenase subunit alpha
MTVSAGAGSVPCRGTLKVIVSVLREQVSGERRVALVPDGVRALVGENVEIRVETGAGEASGHLDAAYEKAGAKITPDPAATCAGADLLLKIQAPGEEELAAIPPSATLVSLMRPLDDLEAVRRTTAHGLTVFALEMIPRITRAQSMDVLSSQATVAGYQAVLMAAESVPKMFPMLVTAAGTISPARVFIVGAGVAGLQAIATARRLGAVVEAYDTRPAVAEQVQSLGARFVELEIDAGDAEDAGGYARAQTEEFYQRQRALMAKRAAVSDVVITTALVPGQRAPLLLDEDGVKGMKPGSVVVDLAAANGGNCECTRPGEIVKVHGVTLVGDTNLPSHLPADASLMFSKNVVTLVKHLAPEGELVLDLEDEITRGTLLAQGGKVVHEAVRSRLEGGS